MRAPSQCDRSIISWPDTPGKRYLSPPENPTTSCGNTGPTTSVRSCSTTARLMRTSTASCSSPPDSSSIRAALMVPRLTNVAGSAHSWLRTTTPGREVSWSGVQPTWAASASGAIGAWVPSATSTVVRVARPCSAPCTASSSSGSGQLRVASGTSTHTLRPSRSTPASCSWTKAVTCSRVGVAPAPPSRATAAGDGRKVCATRSALTRRSGTTRRQPRPDYGGERCRSRAAAPSRSLAPRRSGHPGDRPPAVRGRARAAHHLAPRPRRPAAAARRPSVPRPGDAVRHARPLRHPAAARQWGAARRARCREGRAHRGGVARGVAGAVHPLGRLPGHPGAHLARSGAGRDLRRDAAPVGRHGRRHPRPPRRPARARRPPPPGAVRALRHPRARHHRRPVQRPGGTCGARRRPDVVGTGDPDVPAGPLPRARRPGLARGRRPARRGGRRRHRRLRGLPAGARGAATGLHRPRRHVSRPQPRRRAHRPPRPLPRRRASTARPAPGRPPRGRPSRSVATWCSRWPACRATTG